MRFPGHPIRDVAYERVCRRRGRHAYVMGIGQAVSAKIVYLKPERMHARTGMVARAPRVHALKIAYVRPANVNTRECVSVVRLRASRKTVARADSSHSRYY